VWAEKNDKLQDIDETKPTPHAARRLFGRSSADVKKSSAVGSAVNQILAANEHAPTGTCHRGWTAVGKRASLFDQTVTEEESSDVGDV